MPKKKTRAPQYDGQQGEGSRAFLLTGPFDLDTLRAAITEASGVEQPGLVADGSPTEASEEEPAILWVTDSAPTNEVIEAAIANHEPPVPASPEIEPSPGDTEGEVDRGEVEEVPDPQPVDANLPEDIRPLVAKSEDESFKPQEIETALRFLLRPYRKKAD